MMKKENDPDEVVSLIKIEIIVKREKIEVTFEGDGNEIRLIDLIIAEEMIHRKLNEKINEIKTQILNPPGEISEQDPIIRTLP